ncbi:ATP synthase I [Mesobacillus campisalis]|uniref:ATP synthase I n=1 Tax=Mesobacillus campisalis TaxID=1408103 RepID=A0A0M2SYA5_9BACI|nr:ATP synthase subunit I [Mesobacillus campisalis]KKK37952.1 ATP synthase I [Mesobacillus campisalis]
MPEIQVVFARQRKYIFFLLSIYVLGWGFTVYKPIFAGLVIGTIVSLFNLWLLARRTEKFGEAVMQEKRVRSLGLLSRVAAAVLSIMLAMEYPDQIHLFSVVVGLMTSYFVIMIDFVIQSLHS